MKKEKINLGKVGAVDINIDKFVFGSGGKKIIIMAGMHGNEHTGMFIIKNLIQELSVTETKNTVTLIPNLNPISIIKNIRADGVSSEIQDLNRSFPGSEEGTFTERMAKKIFDEVSSHDLVIDFHTLSSQKLQKLGLLFDFGNDKTKEVLSIMNLLELDQIWNLQDKTIKTDEVHIRSLGPLLARKEILNLAIELNHQNWVTREEIEEISEKLLGLISIFPNIETSTDSIPIFDRKIQRFDNGGLFSTKSEPGDKVNKGDLVGRLFDFDNQKDIEIISDFTGRIMSIQKSDLVNPGDDIFWIGQEKKI